MILGLHPLPNENELKCEVIMKKKKCLFLANDLVSRIIDVFIKWNRKTKQYYIVDKKLPIRKGGCLGVFPKDFYWELDLPRGYIKLVKFFEGKEAKNTFCHIIIKHKDKLYKLAVQKPRKNYRGLNFHASKFQEFDLAGFTAILSPVKYQELEKKYTLA